MSKRAIIEIIVFISVAIVAWLIGNKWQLAECKLDLTFNIVDVITLIVTVIMGIYIAWILEKEVQDKRIEKDMYLSKIGSIEEILEVLETRFQENSGEGIDYKNIVNLEHRIRTKKNSIFKYLIDNSHGKIKNELSKYETTLKNDFKDLRNYLTQTNVCETEPKDIEINNDLAIYSAERITCILTSINSIDNKLLEVKVLVNKM